MDSSYMGLCIKRVIVQHQKASGLYFEFESSLYAKRRILLLFFGKGYQLEREG